MFVGALAEPEQRCPACGSDFVEVLEQPDSNMNVHRGSLVLAGGATATFELSTLAGPLQGLPAALAGPLQG